jgi:uncharacterized protein YoxC
VNDLLSTVHHLLSGVNAPQEGVNDLLSSVKNLRRSVNDLLSGVNDLLRAVDELLSGVNHPLGSVNGVEAHTCVSIVADVVMARFQSFNDETQLCVSTSGSKQYSPALWNF